VNERDAFLKALAKNEDDTPTRMVYADWLDEHGEHEEADRQRKWPAAKAWLVKFCRKHNPAASEDPDDWTWVISYEELVELGRQAIEGAGRRKEYELLCGNNMDMCDALRANSQEFWKNWSIVTGIPLPQDVENRNHFTCAC
jgi:uncharacterized protein (TIGR02996 family)